MLDATSFKSAPQLGSPDTPVLSRLPGAGPGAQMKALGVTIMTWGSTVAYLPEALPLTTIPLNLVPFICFADPCPFLLGCWASLFFSGLFKMGFMPP